MPSLSTILTWPLRHPLATIVIAFLCALLATVGVSRIHADGSLQAMFSRNDPSAEALSRVLNDFGAVDELLVLASIPGEANASPADTARLEQFGDRLVTAIDHDPKSAPLTDGAFDKPDDDSTAYFQHVVAPAAVYYLDDASFAAARRRLTKPQMQAQIQQDQTMLEAPGAAGGLAKALMRDPLRLRDFLGGFTSRMQSQQPFSTKRGSVRFISADGRNLLVFVRGKKPPGDLEFCKQLTAAVKDVAARVNSDHFDLNYGGSYAIAAVSATVIRSDMIASVTGSVLLLQLLFILAYRSPFKLFALSFGPIALGLLLGFGGYSMVQKGLSPMTAVLGGVLAGMAIDYAIQYLSMYESQRDAGQTARRAAATSAVNITPAAFGAWATSVVGFVAIGVSQVNALRDFALLGTLGLTGAFLAKMALMPLLLMLTDRRKSPASPRSTFRFSLTPLLRWTGRHARLCIGFSVIIFLAAIALLAVLPGDLLPLESDLTIMHPRPNSAIDAQNLIARRFGMHDWLLVDLRAKTPGELVELAHRVDQRLTTSAAKQAGVAGSFGLGTLLPDPAVTAPRDVELRQIDPARVVADFRSVIEDSAFNPDAPEIRDNEKLLNAVLTTPPPTIDKLIPYRRLAEMILPRSAFAPGAKITEAITLVFINGSTDSRAARDRAVLGIRAALTGEDGAIVTGLPVISYDAEQTVRHDLPRLSLVALAIVLLYLLVHFRNFAEALLSILPTAFSLVVLLAAMRLAGQRVNMVNLVAAPLLIGIDVDYGIFLVALARLKKVRQDAPAAVIARISPVCHAVVMCAAATIIGYGSLMWTSVPAVRSLGFAVAVGIGACLFSVLFLVVPIFLRLSRGSVDLESS
ncbi:MAG TPA: MMPL family transporter [Tepidisphaeraceae bacterium]|nr:MMPL family transporter [Tepidisphaeraceae bacterium]